LETSQQSFRYDIPAFIAEVEAVIAAETERPRIVQAVEARLQRLLRTPDLLAPEHRTTLPDRYCAHLVAVAPSKTFSVVAMVWLPGQVTAIHDHICWCIVGVLEGLEHETRFRLMQNAAGEQWLLPAGDETMTPGMTGILLPPEENIHQVRNAGETLAISIHIYGADIGAIETHSSINQCFDELPIRDDTAGLAVPWRPTPPQDHPDI
jgi:predicted metal-dependent enzyme (double-stranded beta helix superfamily)